MHTTFLVYVWGDLLTKNLNGMSRRCELQKEYYQTNGAYKGNGKYNDKYVRWLEDQILALRKTDVSGSLPLADLEKRLDEALDKETPETLNKWLEEKRR